MKRILKITALALVIMLVSSLRNKASAQPSADPTYQTFYDELSPYGRWIDYPDYGYVWAPNEGADFRPYSSNGHWVYTDDYEWMWVSDYDWGWAPFHYGRWFNDPYYGWLWMPGYEWAPAWVAWRSGGDYYGWAPLRPGIDINFSLGNYYAPDDYWCFAPSRYITSSRIYDYCVDQRQNSGFINNTIIINSFNRNRNVFVTGPGRYDAERYTGRITPFSFRESSRPGRSEFRNNEVSIYRPQIQRDDNHRFSPRNFDRYDRQSQSNDGRVGQNNNGFRRNGNDPRRDENVNNRDNNLPIRREVQQPSNNNGNNNNSGNDQRRRDVFNGNDNNNRQSNRDNNVRLPRQMENPVVNPNNNNGNNDNRRFERRNDNIQPQRQPQQQVDQQRRQEQPRQFDRSTNGGNRDQNNGGNNGGNNGRGGGHRRG